MDKGHVAKQPDDVVEKDRDDKSSALGGFKELAASFQSSKPKDHTTAGNVVIEAEAGVSPSPSPDPSDDMDSGVATDHPDDNSTGYDNSIHDSTDRDELPTRFAHEGFSYISSCEDLNDIEYEWFVGTPYKYLKEDCMDGVVYSEEEFKAKLEDYSNPKTLTIQEQIELMANKICDDVTSDMGQEIIDVCMEEPRSDERVVDTAARIAWDKTDETELLPNLDETCHSMANNREEINAGLERLSMRSGNRRHLMENGPMTSCKSTNISYEHLT